MSSSPQCKGKSMSGGNTTGAKSGKEYEKLALLLFAKKGYELSINNNSQIRHFGIGREVGIGEDRKLDDVVFRYEENGSRNLIFIQIKHKGMNKQNEKHNNDKSEIIATQDGSLKINSRILSGSGSGKMNSDFSLREYFTSYLSIRKELEITKSKEFRNGEIKYVAIFTNIGFDKEDLINNGFILNEAPGDVRTLLQLGKSSIGTQKTNNCYQFLKISEVLQTRFKKCSDLHRIAKEFARFLVYENHRKNKVMHTDKAPIKYYHVALEKEVIEKSSEIQKNDKDECYCDAKFRKKFIDNNDTGPKKQLLDAIFEAVRDLDKSKRNNNNEVLKNDLKNTEWKVVPHFGHYLPKESSSELHKIAGDFAAYIIKKNERDKVIFGKKETILTHYDVAFEKEVLTILDQSELSYCKAKFRPEFINNREMGPKQDLKKAIFDSIREFQSKEGDGLEEILRGFQVKEDDELEGILRELEVKVDPYFVKSVNFEEDLPNEWIPIEDADITDFLNCLVFIINQPNETDLLTQINSVKEVFLQDTGVGEALNNMDKNIRDRIEKAHGIYNKDSNNEIWIYGERMNEFVKEQQAVVKVAVISSIYEEKIMQYGEFKKLGKLVNNLRNFLNDKFSKVLCLCSPTTMLTLIKVLKYINTKNSPAKEKSISIELDDAKCKIITDIIEKAFTSESYNLLTVECRHAVSEDIFKLYCKFSPIIKSNTNKKIILIINANELKNLTKKIRSDLKDIYKNSKKHCDPKELCIEKTDDVIVKDFKPKEDPFKKEMIFFQGQKEKLNLEKLTGIADWKSYIAYSSPNGIQNEGGILDAITLFLKNEEVIVGSRPLGTDSLECAYASLPEENKEINKENLVTKLLQQGRDSKANVIYIVSGIAGSDENEKMSKLFNILGLKEINEEQLGDINRIQIKDEQFKEESFKNICHEHSEKEIFWIYTEHENLFKLQKLFNPNFYLERKYCIKNEQSEKFCIGEDELIKEIKDRKMVIISDDPGMGKSTTMTKLFEFKHLSESFLETHWIIRINLKDKIQPIKNVKLDNGIIDIVNFLSNVDSELNNNITKSLLEFALSNRKTTIKPLLLVLDRFDEILDREDRDKVVALLEFLKEKTAAKVWITALPIYKETYKLMTFAIGFDPVNYELYIKQFFKDRLQLNLNKEKFDEIFDESQGNSCIRIYSKAFLNKLKSVFTGDISRFIGTPLHLHLMLDGSVNSFKCWVENETKQDPNFDYLGDDIREVHETFINKKFDIYCQKTCCGGREQSRFIFDYCNKSLARCLIFELDLKSEPVLKTFKDIASLAGIIKYYRSKVCFIVTSFEDFYCAKLFIDWIKGVTHDELPGVDGKKYILENALRKPKFKLIRSFLNLELGICFNLEGDEKIKFEERLKQYGRKAKELFENERNSLIDENGTVLHIAVEEGNRNIVRFVLNSLKEHEDVLREILLAPDKGNVTALDLSSSGKDNETFNLLLDAEHSVGMSGEREQEIFGRYEKNRLNALFTEIFRDISGIL